MATKTAKAKSKKVKAALPKKAGQPANPKTQWDERAVIHQGVSLAEPRRYGLSKRFYITLTARGRQEQLTFSRLQVHARDRSVKRGSELTELTIRSVLAL